MKKQIVRYGSSLVFVFHQRERDMYNIKEGQVYELKMELIDNKKLKENKIKG